MQDIWKTWSDLKRICKDKKVIFWGRSEDLIPKTVQKFNFVDEKYIVDMNEAYHGTSFHGVEVFSPEKLKDENRNDVYIVITGSMYDDIAQCIEKMGFESGAHYCCTPEIKDWVYLLDVRDYEQNVIIACTDYTDKSEKRHSKMGGGLFFYNTASNELKKMQSGHFRQITEVGDVYYTVEFVEKKVYVFSKDLKKQLDVFEIDPGSKRNEKPNSCGIAYHKEKQLIFIANAGSDTINIYSQDGFKYVDTLHFSEKFKKYGDGQHHINDVCVDANHLYVSYFSLSGNWKKGVMDGGVSQYDIDDFGQGHIPVASNLWMPHSPEIIEGNLCYIDSMRGALWTGGQAVAGEFPGFLRGLSHDGRFYYLGQSEDMYVERLFGVSNNIMVNAGFYLFDVTKKVSRFYSTPFIMNVHDIHVDCNNG